MTNAADLDRWVDGIRRRSDEAFREVYALLADDLASFANGMLRDRRAAEDTVQQAFLELVKAAPRFRGDGRSLRAWLFRSVRFNCLDEIKRRSRRPEAPTEHLPERPSSPPDAAVEGLEPALEEALSALAPRQRALIVLRHVVGLSGEEIASVVRSNRTAVYAALGRAERRFRQTYDHARSTTLETGS